MAIYWLLEDKRTTAGPGYILAAGGQEDDQDLTIDWLLEDERTTTGPGYILAAGGQEDDQDLCNYIDWLLALQKRNNHH
jgi:hypothetical protein